MRIGTRPVSPTHEAHQVRGAVARRHEVDQRDGAVGGFEARLQDQGVVA